jgi:MFS superfamily sulfate permease-like transporter
LPSPDWNGLLNYKVWIQGLTIALVASLETLLGLEAVDKLDPEKRNSPTNRELKAQGIGNVVSGFFGGLPLTSVIVRSSANVNSGAKTKVSAIVHGLMLFTALLFFAPIMNKIPNAALASILIFTGYKLAKLSLFVEMYKKGWNQFIPFMVTIVAINLTDLLRGVMIGIVVGLFYIIRSNFRTATTFVQEGNSYKIQLKKEVSFLHKLEIKQELAAIPDGAKVIINTVAADFIDQDVQEEIKKFLDTAKERNIDITVESADDKTYLFI